MQTRKVTFFRRFTSGLGDRLGTGRAGEVKSLNEKYRSFKEARKFARALELKTEKEWQKYCKGDIKGRVTKPEDIPADPRHTYTAQGWQGFGDWLGTGRVANQKKKYRSFKEARKFVHALKLKNQKEWRQYSKEGLKGRKPKPEDIPSSPERTYKAQGWQGMGDWIGTGAIALRNKKFLSFKEARKFVHALKLKNQKEWRRYCRGELKGRRPRPKDIPANPRHAYKTQGWQGMGDWIGTGRVADRYKQYRSFKEARKFVHALKIKSRTEWRQYCRGELEGRKRKPEDIATNPHQTYKNKGWQGMGDWLGTGTIAPRYREYRSFKEARKFVHALKLKSITEWRRYCKGELKGRKRKPGDIPADPRNIYKAQGWKNWSDWVGTGNNAN